MRLSSGVIELGWSMNFHKVILLALGFSVATSAFAEIGVAPVMQSAATAVYVADATVQAIKQSVVSAQVPGRVLQLLVRAGDAVTAGQVIVRLDDRESVAVEASSEAAIYEAQANLARAELDLKRTQELSRRNFVSTAALDQSESQVKALRARIESLQATHRAAGATRSHAAITAPYTGLVAATQAEVGDMAMPGKPIVTLFEPGRLRVVAYVPETRMEGVRAGLAESQPVVDVGGQRVAGTQTTILPAADPGTRTTEIRIDLPPNARATPGQFAQVRFALAISTSSPRLSIPATAILRRGELTAVYVRIGGERFQQRQVRVGDALPDGSIEVLAGLRAGEYVALDPVKAGIEALQPPPGK